MAKNVTRISTAELRALKPAQCRVFKLPNRMKIYSGRTLIYQDSHKTGRKYETVADFEETTLTVTRIS